MQAMLPCYGGWRRREVKTQGGVGVGWGSEGTGEAGERMRERAKKPGGTAGAPHRARNACTRFRNGRPAVRTIP